MARGLPPGYTLGSPLTVFRRIPGTRRYYNARTYAEQTTTGQTFTEHFVIRKYNPSRTEAERRRIREEAIKYRGRLLKGRYTYQQAFMLKARADNLTPPSPHLQEQFNEAYGRYLLANHNARRVTRIVTRQQWDELHSPDSELAQSLAALGMRHPSGPDARIPVTTSPQAYFSGEMRPFFERTIRTGMRPTRRRGLIGNTIL